MGYFEGSPFDEPIITSKPKPPSKLIVNNKLGLDFSIVRYWSVHEENGEILNVYLYVGFGKEINISDITQETFQYLIQGLENYFYGSFQPKSNIT